MMGEVTQPGAPFRMSETPWEINTPAPLLGEHNSGVYGKLLGFSEAEIQKLKAEKVI